MSTDVYQQKQCTDVDGSEIQLAKWLRRRGIHFGFVSTPSTGFPHVFSPSHLIRDVALHGMRTRIMEAFHQLCGVTQSPPSGTTLGYLSMVGFW